jgi:hypothetical protein
VLAECRTEPLVIVPQTLPLAFAKVSSGGGSLDGFRETRSIMLKFDEHSDIVDEPSEKCLVDGVLPIGLRDDPRGACRNAGVTPEIVRIEVRPEVTATKQLCQTRRYRVSEDRRTQS